MIYILIFLVAKVLFGESFAIFAKVNFEKEKKNSPPPPPTLFLQCEMCFLSPFLCPCTPPPPPRLSLSLSLSLSFASSLLSTGKCRGCEYQDQEAAQRKAWYFSVSLI